MIRISQSMSHLLVLLNFRRRQLSSYRHKNTVGGRAVYFRRDTDTGKLSEVKYEIHVCANSPLAIKIKRYILNEEVSDLRSRGVTACTSITLIRRMM